MRKICITNGNVILYADLNDTVAANDFAKRLPCRFSGADSGIDYCCKAANGVYDPLETQAGWKNGDLCLCGGWFAILYGGEEESRHHRNMMIIGRVEEKSLEQIRNLPDKANFYVNFA